MSSWPEPALDAAEDAREQVAGLEYEDAYYGRAAEAEGLDPDRLDEIAAYGYADDSGYELDDPKHPSFHTRHADLWDNREGK